GALGLDAGLDKGALSGVERQLVKIAVSTENGCTYCEAAHSTIAGMLQARPEIVNAVRTGVPVSDAKIDALVRFTRAVVRNKGFVQQGETAAFLAAGYTKAQVLEVVGHVAAKTLANYIHAITNAPLDAAFQPQRWDAEQLKVACGYHARGRAVALPRQIHGGGAARTGGCPSGRDRRGSRRVRAGRPWTHRHGGAA